ncbi:hypothetical protein J2W27_004938 [Variovorax boronicumulans]|nr:hypothetical protein [Variovorax boronicumulans]
MIWFTSRCSFVFRGRVSPRRATHFLLLRQKKVSKEKATPLSATLRFATGNLRCSRFAGSRRTRFAQTAASPDPRNAPLLGAARGEGELGPSLRSALQYQQPNPTPMRAASPARISLRTPMSVPAPTPLPIPAAAGAKRLLRPTGRAKRWPVGIPTPSVCAEERSVSRIRARPCLSEASLGETPRNVSTAGCPQRSGGTQTAGSPFFCLRFFGEAKKSRSAAGPRPGPGKQAPSGVRLAGAGQ